MTLALLGGLTAQDFLRRHWQKRPLFVPRALPQFTGIIGEHALRKLALRNDVESRMVERSGNRWDTKHGPFERKLALRSRNSSLLVSGVNLHLAGADDLLRRFAFIPQARLDDVMVSFATPGGGVGPHVDSYDVFLLQGSGRRRWTVWDPRRRASIYVAQPGDLLYLPPGWQHDGVALEPCFTYSIGFRAPRGSELGAGFLDWLHERGLPEARYRDPGLRAARRPAAIPAEMLRFADQVLARITWSKADVADFLGRYLTMPKPHVVFRPAGRRLPLARCAVRLAPATQLLYLGRKFFINGDAVIVPGGGTGALRELADQRAARGTRLARARLAALMSEWQRLGYVNYERV